MSLGPEVLDSGCKVGGRKNCVNRKAKIKQLMKIDENKFNPSCLAFQCCEF